MKTTAYFNHMRKRPDRAIIKDEWIARAIRFAEKTEIQFDGRIRKWAWIPEEGKFLRVILLEDGETVHNAFFDRSFRGGWSMRVKYFSDTDTALVEFTDHEVSETKEISENIYVDLDGQGNLVSMTIEHARSNAQLHEFSYHEIAGVLEGQG